MAEWFLPIDRARTILVMVNHGYCYGYGFDRAPLSLLLSWCGDHEMYRFINS
jgi:hypothetical protein